MLSLSSSTNNSIHCSESVSGIRIEAGCSAVSISIIEKATNRRNLDYFSHSIFIVFICSFFHESSCIIEWWERLVLQHDRVCEARTSNRLSGEFVSRYCLIVLYNNRKSKGE